MAARRARPRAQRAPRRPARLRCAARSVLLFSQPRASGAHRRAAAPHPLPRAPPQVLCDKNIGPKVRLVMEGGGAERPPHESSPPLRAARVAHTTISPRQRLGDAAPPRVRPFCAPCAVPLLHACSGAAAAADAPSRLRHCFFFFILRCAPFFSQPVPSVKRPRSHAHAGGAFDAPSAKRATPLPPCAPAGYAGHPAFAPRTGSPGAVARAKAARSARPTPPTAGGSGSGSGSGFGAAAGSGGAGGATGASARAPPSPVPWRGLDATTVDAFASPLAVLARATQADAGAARAQAAAEALAAAAAAAARDRSRSYDSGMDALAAAAGVWSDNEEEGEEGASPVGAPRLAAAVVAACAPPAPPSAKRVDGAGAVAAAHGAAAAASAAEAAAAAARALACRARAEAYAALPAPPPGRDSARRAPSDPANAAVRRAVIGPAAPQPGCRSAAGFVGIHLPQQPQRSFGVLLRLRLR